MKISGRLLAAVVLLYVSSTAFAQAPKTLGYQATLSDSTGPLTGTHSFTFKIYDAASGGVVLWTETSSGVLVTNGNLSITLGKINPINIQTVKPLWMGIAVDSNPEISPRVELSASLYSLGLALPYAATVSSGVPNGGQLMNLTYAGDSSVALIRLNYNGTALSNPFVINHNGTGAGMVLTQSGTLGTGAIFGLSNAANPQSAIRGQTSGTGSAGQFLVTNGSSTAAAVSITHNGTGNAITANRPIQATQFIGDGSLLTNLPSSGSLSLPYSNTESDSSALFGVTNSGPGYGLYGENSSAIGPNAHGVVGKATANGNNAGVYGTTVGGTGVMGETSTGWSAIFGYLHTPGFGWAGNFENDNPLNTTAALHASTGGTGMAIEGQTNTGWTAIYGSHFGAAGLAGKFQLHNAANSWAALEGETAGTGTAVRGLNTGTAGHGGRFEVNNSSNGYAALEAETSGTGPAVRGLNTGTSGQGGRFEVTNASNNYPAVEATSAGGGAAVRAQTATAWAAVSAENNGPGFAIHAQNTGSGSGFAAFFQNSSPTNNFPAIQATSAGAGSSAVRAVQEGSNLGKGMDIYMGNPSSTAEGFTVSTVGLGVAGAFTVDNASSTSSALSAWTNGTAPSIYGATAGSNGAAYLSIDNPLSNATVLNINNAGSGYGIYSNAPIEASAFIGDGSQLTGLPPLTLPFASTVETSDNAFVVQNDGMGTAGAFHVNNSGSASSAVYAQSLGLGPVVSVIQSYESSSSPAIYGTVVGYGSGMRLNINNSSNSEAGIEINHYGTGNAITANAPISASSFIGDGSQLTNLPSFALPFSSTSSDPSTLFNINSSGDATAGAFIVSNGAGNQPALVASTNGTGSAAAFGNSNADNNSSIVSATSYGTGNTLAAQSWGYGKAGDFRNTNSNNANYALTALTQGTGGAGEFSSTNVDATAPALTVSAAGTGGAVSISATNADASSPALRVMSDGYVIAGSFENDGGGAALVATSYGSGHALNMYAGGLKYSVQNVTSDPITVRAGAYEIAGGGTSFTFTFSANAGDTCIVFNGTGNQITVEGVTVDPDETRQLIYLAGSWRGL
jgi:hypothetical protein